MWELSFTHDEHGTATDGSKAELITAIQAGCAVRAVWTMGSIEHSADVPFVAIHHGEVFGQLAAIIRQRPSMEAAVIDLDDAGETWHGLLATTGELRHRFSVSGPLPTMRSRMSWFIQRSGAPS